MEIPHSNARCADVIKKKKKSLQKHQETAPWTDLEQKVFVDKRSVCFNPLGLPMVAERVSVVANSLEAFYVSLLRKFSYFLQHNHYIINPKQINCV